MSIKLTTKQINLFICLVLFLGTVASRIPVMRTVGETWDEQTASVQIGERYLGNIKRLDFSKAAWDIGAEHPPLARYFYGAARLIPKAIPTIRDWDNEYHQDKEYTLPRLLSAIFSGLTVILVYLIGKYLFDRRVGIVSALILTTHPAFIAYTSTSSLESVFIFMTTLFVWSLIHALKTGSTKWHFLAVVVLTMSFLTRYNGAFFIGFYAVIVLFKYQKQILTLKLSQIPWPVIFSPFIFLGLVYLSWPWLWSQPLGLLESFSRTPAFVTNEYFLGKIGPMPWYYYFVYFLVVTPEIILVLLSAFLLRFSNFKHLISKSSFQFPASNLFLLAWFLTPFLATFVSFKQDGIRYVVAFIPALTLISGYTIIWILNCIKSSWLKIAFVSIVIIGTMYPAILFFPYYLDYYNLASGGPKAAYENNRFDVGWWGEGGLAAVRYINKNLPPESSIRVSFLPLHVLPKFREDLVLIRDNNTKADFVLVNDFSQNYGPKVDLNGYNEIFEESTPRLKSLAAPLVQIWQKKLE